MQAPGVEGGAKYGTEAGYSEDYGAAKRPEPLPGADDQGYGTMTSTNGGAAGASAGQPVNPFTQQQYDGQKSSNPFKQ